MKIGITGQAGFIGSHLYNYLGVEKDIERVPFLDNYFSDEKALRSFVKQCDVIVHLAAVNRHEDQQVLHEINVKLVTQLIKAMEQEKVHPHVIFSSSTQEELDNPYGNSKREGAQLFEKWAKNNKANFTRLVIPNVYGPFGQPYYNSFVATFCYQLTHSECPTIKIDSNVKLIYVGSLCKFIIETIRSAKQDHVQKIEVPYDFDKKVTEVLCILSRYKEQYFDNGFIPVLNSKDEINLFNTFVCFIDHKEYFPKKLKLSSDDRGMFVETMKIGVGGQVSFSTTVPGITRGDHYHTRKIERFVVIKGQARIKIRKIGTNDAIEFELNGKEPSFVDMPIWHTHNITNIGKDELYTQFWINEWYDANNADTFFEKV